MSSEQLRQAVEKSIEILVPIPKKHNPAVMEGRFTLGKFVYDTASGSYHRPHDEQLARCGIQREQGNRTIADYKIKQSVCQEGNSSYGCC